MRCSVLLSLLVLFSPLTAEDVTQVDQLEVDRFASDEEYAEDLPEAQPWGQARVDDDDDVIYLDDDKRIVAEQLIQELDEISSKLDDGDKRTIGASQAITSTDLANVDTLLFNAGLTPRNKPKIRNVGKLSSLDSLFERSDSQSDPISERVPLLVPGMTKKNVEDIKTELKQMLFSTEYADKKVKTTHSIRNSLCHSPRHHGCRRYDVKAIDVDHSADFKIDARNNGSDHHLSSRRPIRANSFPLRRALNRLQQLQVRPNIQFDKNNSTILRSVPIIPIVELDCMARCYFEISVSPNLDSFNNDKSTAKLFLRSPVALAAVGE